MASYGGSSGGYGSPYSVSTGGFGPSKKKQPGYDVYGNTLSAPKPSSLGGTPGGTTDFSGAPQLPYQPNAPKVQNLIDPMAAAGSGLLDPGSDYSKKMRGELWEDIGDKTAAQQRASSLMAARSGLGAGGSPELLETQGDIGRQGLEAYGDASAQSVLGGMQLGGSLMQPALGAQMGLQGQQQQAYMAQQSLQAQQQAQQLQANLEQQRLQQEQMLREMALMYGGF